MGIRDETCIDCQEYMAIWQYVSGTDARSHPEAGGAGEIASMSLHMLTDSAFREGTVSNEFMYAHLADNSRSVTETKPL